MCASELPGRKYCAMKGYKLSWLILFCIMSLSIRKIDGRIQSSTILGK
jgi:hypothetical protein